MALVFKDRVKDTSTTSGTGNLTLSGTAPTGYKAFATAYATGSTNQFQYCIVDNTTGDWETGAGYISNSTTLVRSKVYANSLNTTALIAFAGNSKDVFVTPTANAVNGYGPSDSNGCLVWGYNTAGAMTTANTNSTYLGSNQANSLTSLSVANTFVGTNAGAAITSCNGSTFVGYNAGCVVTTATNSTYLGSYAGGGFGGGVTTGTENVLIGTQAGYRTNGSSLTNVGTYAGIYNNASNNTAVGYKSLYGVSGSSTGGNNTAVGYQTGLALTTGTTNTLVGYNAGNAITSGSNNLVLGNNAQPSSATVSNEITLADANITALRCNVQTITSLSDARDKTNITQLPLGLDFINTLKPVKFRWDRRDGTMQGAEDLGFIAQDLDAAQIKYAADDYLQIVNHSNPDKLEASYSKLIPVLVKAIQELSEEVRILKGI